MKRYFAFLAVFVLVLPFVHGQEIKGFVNDYVGVLSAADSGQITTIAQQIFDSGTAQYAVVIINTTNGQDIQEYGLNLAQGKLGDSAKHNGVLLLVAIQDRNYWFEVGKGIEGTLNDAKVARLGRDYLVSNFRNGEYGKGIVQASQALHDVLVSNETQQDSEQTNAPTDAQINQIIIAAIILFFVLSIVIRILRRKADKYHNAAEGAIVLFGGRGGFGRGGFGGFGGSGGFGGGGFSGGGGGGGW